MIYHDNLYAAYEQLLGTFNEKSQLIFPEYGYVGEYPIVNHVLRLKEIAGFLDCLTIIAQLIEEYQLSTSETKPSALRYLKECDARISDMIDNWMQRSRSLLHNDEDGYLDALAYSRNIIQAYMQGEMS